MVPAECPAPGPEAQGGMKVASMPGRMGRKIAGSILALVAASGCAGTSGPGGARHPWIPDQGDGTYRNPVIFADYSDPDVIRVGSDYYLVSSSFHSTPGLPILRSPDLVNWT